MQQIAFDPADPRAALAQLPQTSAVFALYGAEVCGSWASAALGSAGSKAICCIATS